VPAADPAPVRAPFEISGRVVPPHAIVRFAHGIVVVPQDIVELVHGIVVLSQEIVLLFHEIVTFANGTLTLPKETVAFPHGMVMLFQAMVVFVHGMVVSAHGISSPLFTQVVPAGKPVGKFMSELRTPEGIGFVPTPGMGFVPTPGMVIPGIVPILPPPDVIAAAAKAMNVSPVVWGLRANTMPAGQWPT